MAIASARRGIAAAAATVAAVTIFACAPLTAALTKQVPAKPSVPAVAPAPVLGKGIFTNPIVQNAADPWIVYRDGYYYLLYTMGNRIGIRKSPTLAGLGEVSAVQVWKGGMPGYETYTHDVWAPELHYLNGKWYIYFCATDGPDPNRRVFCLEAKTSDPLGEYTFKGRMTPPDEANFPGNYAIDPTVFQRKRDGKLFYLWSGRDRKGGGQNIYLAPLSDPWTVSGPRVRLSVPEFDWEKHGWAVNEGPEVLEHDGKTFVVYSASGGTTRHYCLGLITNTDGDLLNQASWSKSKQPVFQEYEGPDGNVYTTAHGGFFVSPDGKEEWMVYHGKDMVDNTWKARHTRAQRFTWRPDGTPDFGHPIPPGIPLTAPSGEKMAEKVIANGK